ncbi:MAG: GNAT family N-acetyltransferase [Burkholderiaceae bacterium]
MSEPHALEPFSRCFYDQHIPSFVETALDQRYGSLYASLPQLGLYSLQGISTYVELHRGDIQEIFLYQRDRRRIVVVNQGMTLCSGAAQRFADAVFQHEQGTNRVYFDAVCLSNRHQLKRKIYLPVSEDIVINLPSNASDYLAAPSKSLRKSLQSRLKRTTGLRHQVIAGDLIDHQILQKIIGFNHARMAAKQQDSAIDREAYERLLHLARARGAVGTLEIDGRLCAGRLVCRFGDDVFSLLNAHDPAMNTLGLGKVLRYLMVLDAIRSGAKRFHLLGGYFSSKRPFGARRMPLYSLLIYRHRSAMLLDIGKLIQLMLRSLEYQFRTYLDDQKSEATNKLQRSFSISSVSVLPRHQRSVSGLWRE